MTRQPLPVTSSAPLRPIARESTGPEEALPDPAEGLALVKPGVRAQAGYTLRSPAARRKLNQNECPHDLPPELKRAVLDRAGSAPWQRYPEFVPARLVERLAGHYGWVPEGVVVGNGSNELIQATLSVVLAEGDPVIVPCPAQQGFKLDPADLERAITRRTKWIILNSPS
ncbi:MAG TPA: aminotransferase class I/II-fold pyridoxal phosphate-dependent enzyme, partial [Gemmatimonadales bacterium]